jgi:hypothetical protein
VTVSSETTPDVCPVWSDTCRWTDLAILSFGFQDWFDHLMLERNWMTIWTATLRHLGSDVVVMIRDVPVLPCTSYEPVRHFSWRRDQVHRPGLYFMVSTGRHHGYESLAEARALLMLNFAGNVTHVLSQPMELRFVADSEFALSSQGGDRRRGQRLMPFHRSVARWSII